MQLYGQLFRLFGLLPSELDQQDAEEFATILQFAFEEEVRGVEEEKRMFFEIEEE